MTQFSKHSTSKIHIILIYTPQSHTITPVSYTHLDVYKRQTSNPNCDNESNYLLSCPASLLHSESMFMVEGRQEENSEFGMLSEFLNMATSIINKFLYFVKCIF